MSKKEFDKERWEICLKCDNLTPIKTCKKCGCVMPVKVKFKGAKCPIGKW